VSDQDFFFDEEEQAAEKPAAKATERPARAEGAKPVATGSTTSTAQSVSMTVAALIGVVALLAGVVIGILIPAGADTTVPEPTTTGTQAAPQLSPEQLESGQMPPGHPQVGAPTGEATGSAPATP